MSEMKLS